MLDTSSNVIMFFLQKLLSVNASKLKQPSFLLQLNRKYSAEYDYDLLVIGGGSGGLAAAKEAAFLGAKVGVVDYVTPTPLGTTWGLGGTCVNVGCIPKKLMHQAALMGEAIVDARKYGWRVESKVTHNWQRLKDAVQAQIKSENSRTVAELTNKNVKYINGLGSFEDPYTLLVTGREGTYSVTAKYFLIAVGGRPKYPEVPGAMEYGVTSDDIFSLEKPPGKTMIVGAGCVGLECAGVFNVLGYDTTVMMRSVPLRGLDQQMAAIVTAEIQRKGVKFLNKCLLKRIQKLKPSGKLKVDWVNTSNNSVSSDEFDTIMFAIGRRPLTKEIRLEKTGVTLPFGQDKIETTNEQTNVPHIFAVGDVLFNGPELTPVATLAGKLLSRRLFGGSKQRMDYRNVATTIFTPLEYGFVGLSEESANNLFGQDHIEVYHSFYKPTEFSLAQKSAENCYLKVIASRSNDQVVLGMHFVGPQAGEVIQGFSTAMKCNLTVNALMNTIGIHPTLAEEFCRISITKRSGLDPTPASCCS